MSGDRCAGGMTDARVLSRWEWVSLLSAFSRVVLTRPPAFRSEHAQTPSNCGEILPLRPYSQIRPSVAARPSRPPLDSPPKLSVVAEPQLRLRLLLQWEALLPLRLHRPELLPPLPVPPLPVLLLPVPPLPVLLLPVPHLQGPPLLVLPLPGPLLQELHQWQRRHSRETVLGCPRRSCRLCSNLFRLLCFSSL